VLAEGVYRAALRISKEKGVDALRYAVHSKGVGIGAHGVRNGKDFLPDFSYAASTQGGDHTSAPDATAGFSGELRSAFEDSAVICSFNMIDGLAFDMLYAVAREGWRSRLLPLHSLVKGAQHQLGGLVGIGGGSTR
jgi:aldehyde:ferredoxin oxidoreductase